MMSITRSSSGRCLQYLILLILNLQQQPDKFIFMEFHFFMKIDKEKYLLSDKFDYYLDIVKEMDLSYLELLIILLSQIRYIEYGIN